MKKILLSFLGVLFFAHLVYATAGTVTLKRRDISGQADSSSIAITNMSSSAVIKEEVLATGKIWKSLYENSEQCSWSGTTLTCDFSKYASQYVPSKSVFVNKSRCDDFRKKTTGDNNNANCNSTINTFPYLTCASGYTWDYDRLYCKRSSTNKLTVKFYDYDKSLARTDQIYGTNQTASGFVNQYNKNKAPCQGWGSSGDIACSVSGSEVHCTVENCPHPVFWTSNKCTSYRNNNNKDTADDCVALTNQDPKIFSRTASINNYGEPDRNYTDVDGDGGEWPAYYAWCKKYYRSDYGANIYKDGKCTGTYQRAYKDASYTYSSSDKHGLANSMFTSQETTHIVNQPATDAATLNENSPATLPNNSGKTIVCEVKNSSGVDVTHGSDPGTGIVTCSCPTDYFWTKAACQEYRKDHSSQTDMYDHICYDTGKTNCGWQLKDAEKTVKSCPAGMSFVNETTQTSCKIGS